MNTRPKRVEIQRADMFFSAIIFFAMSLGLSSLSFGAEPATASQAKTASSVVTPAASVTTANATAEPDTTTAEDNFVLPEKFYNSSITASKGNSQYFDPSILTGDFRKKYYQSCFVQVFLKSFLHVEIINLSTHKISTCPVEEFKKITAASVIAQLATVAPVTLVGLVGPNFQMMDENNSDIDSKYIPLGNLNFSAVMHAHVGIKDIFHSFDIVKNVKRLWRWGNVDVSYNPILTKRNMDYVWYRGRTIFVLTSDTGKNYVLAFYNPNDIENFTSSEYLMKRLNNMANTLNLPPGWTYKSVVLKKILRLHQIPFEGYVGETVVDELQNVYLLANNIED
jgi:hypothetical protein